MSPVCSLYEDCIGAHLSRILIEIAGQDRTALGMQDTEAIISPAKAKAIMVAGSTNYLAGV